MGYTHYFTQHRDFSATEWLKLTNAVRAVIKDLPASVGVFDADGSGEPTVDGVQIAFNGDASVDEAHESMVVHRYMEDARWRDGTGPVFQFCKTARKPYDTLVCAVLLLAIEIAPNVYELDSDGDMRGPEWQPARDLLAGVSVESDSPDDVAAANLRDLLS